MGHKEQQENREPIVINNTNEVLGFLEKALKFV